MVTLWLIVRDPSLCILRRVSPVTSSSLSLSVVRTPTTDHQFLTKSPSFQTAVVPRSCSSSNFHSSINHQHCNWPRSKFNSNNKIRTILNNVMLPLSLTIRGSSSLRHTDRLLAKTRFHDDDPTVDDFLAMSGWRIPRLLDTAKYISITRLLTYSVVFQFW